MGVNLRTVSIDEFSKIIDRYLNSAQDSKKISGIMIDLNKNHQLEYITNIKIKSDNSIKVLSEHNLYWPKLSETYIIDYIKMVGGMIQNGN